MTQKQTDALRHLLGCVGHTASLGQFRIGTINRLLLDGFITREYPEPTTWAQASRGRVPYYRLTEKGREATKDGK